jgi:hypothetical protein
MAPTLGGVPLPPHLLPQLEQLGGCQAPAGCGFLAADFLSLRRPVGGHCIPHFTAAHLADPEKVPRNGPCRTTGAG